MRKIQRIAAALCIMISLAGILFVNGREGNKPNAGEALTESVETIYVPNTIRYATAASSSVIGEARYVSVDTLNVRNRPTTDDSKIIGKKYKNDKVILASEVDPNGWVEIQFDSSEKAFVKAEYLSQKMSVSNSKSSQKTTSGETNKGAVSTTDVKAASTSQQQVSTMTYVLNTNTKKAHSTGCRDIAKMKASNRKDVSSDPATLSAQGYSPCGHCHPW